MGSKLHPGEFDAYAAALPDEPMFVLLARDDTAPGKLRSWADERRQALTHSLEENPDLRDDPAFMERYREDLRKCTAADELADDMVVWRMRNAGVWRDQSQVRLPMPEIVDQLRQDIAAAARQAVARYCAVGDAQVLILEHRVSPWSVPGFSVRRHYFRLEGKGEPFARFEGNQHPTLDQFRVVGHDVVLGDVFAKVKGPNDLRLELQLLELDQRHDNSQPGVPE